MKTFLRRGDPFIWLSGSALAFCLLIVAGLIAVVAVNGLGFFWPRDVARLELADGTAVFGEILRRQEVPADDSGAGAAYRLQVKTGNRDVYGLDFRWIPEAEIVSTTFPAEAAVLERVEWGDMLGVPTSFSVDGGEPVGLDTPQAWEQLAAARARVDALRKRIRRLQLDEIAAVNTEIEEIRLHERKLRPEDRGLERLASRREVLRKQYEILTARLSDLRSQGDEDEILVALASGQTRRVQLADVVRLYLPNQMGTAGKSALYAGKAWEFLSGQPRESNTEGGIFPALFGTVMMVIIMTLAVVPFGVLASLYLREYARQGPLVRLIRIAVNNLAGVPSIVFGMFGLGFFVYGVGAVIDHLFFSAALPAPTFGTGGILWASLTLALLTLPVVIVATEEALGSVPAGIREGSLALGSTKLQMIWRVVLPGALPGILTGVILATARGAGEVAPLMITGVVKLAPDLPLDAVFPFLHLERKFMHLGFHIYDVGFQSSNVEAARPMAYATTFLLLALVLVLNLTAIVVRKRLRMRYAPTSL